MFQRIGLENGCRRCPAFHLPAAFIGAAPYPGHWANINTKQWVAQVIRARGFSHLFGNIPLARKSG